MSARYIRNDLIQVRTPARSRRTSDRRKHAITVRYVEPRQPATAERVRANTMRNDGLRAHNDLRAKLYA